jgi:hypothetical protein
MDGTVIGILANGVMKAIELAVKARRGRNLDEATANEELRKSEELALHYWGCVLWEMRAGCELVRHMNQASPNIAFTALDFSISDAIMPDFCRVVPSPPVLGRFQNILSALRRVDFFQRVAASRSLSREDMLSETSPYGQALGFAQDAHKKDIYGRFNSLVSVGHNIGRAVYGEGNWGGDSVEFFPNKVDTEAPIDHSLI